MVSKECNEVCAVTGHVCVCVRAAACNRNFNKSCYVHVAILIESSKQRPHAACDLEVRQLRPSSQLKLEQSSSSSNGDSTHTHTYTVMCVCCSCENYIVSRCMAEGTTAACSPRDRQTAFVNQMNSAHFQQK